MPALQPLLLEMPRWGIRTDRLSPKQAAIVEHIQQHGEITLDAATRLVGANVYANQKKHTGALLSNMVRRGIIVRTKPGRFSLTVAVCPKCGKPGVFIRERPFADGSGKVFMCTTPKCENKDLYLYPK